MSNRSTRNKIRFQCKSAIDDLNRANDHLGQLAALADERSQFVNDNLPQIMAFIELSVKTMRLFYEKL